MDKSSIVVFAGPSIDQKIRLKYQFDFKPPAQQADIYQAAKNPDVKTIVLLDGYYKTVPSVWHKEIIYALNNGKTVIGAASLGALRAAELDSYGMIGIGKIFKWYHENLLTRDPDVAVLHDTKESDYKTLTVPIVNIKATLETIDKDLDTTDIERVLDISRSIFFEQRTLKSLVSKLNSLKETLPILGKVIAALQHNYIDQKREDSIAALDYISHPNRQSLISDVRPIKNQEKLNETLYWDALKKNDSYVSNNKTGLLQTRQALLTMQLLQDPDKFLIMRNRAVSIEICNWLADLYGIEPDTQRCHSVRMQMLDDLGITESELIKYTSDKGLTMQEVDEYINATAIEQEVTDRATYRSPLCAYNSTHYAMLMLTKGNRDVNSRLEYMESILEEETLSAIEELSETVDSLPQEMHDAIEKYRVAYSLPKGTSTISDITRLSTGYILTFSKIYKRFSDTIKSILQRGLGMIDE